MNTLKSLRAPLSLLALVAIIAAGALYAPAFQTNPAFGPVNGGPQGQPFLPAATTPATVEYIATANAPVLGSNCYNPIIMLIDTQAGNYWICAQVPNTSRTSLGTWTILTGSYGLSRGFQTLASAATIAPTFTNVTLSGTTAVTAITVPAGLQTGATYTFITTSATTNDFPTGNNITGTGTGITTVAGQALQFIYDGTNFHYRA